MQDQVRTSGLPQEAYTTPAASPWEPRTLPKDVLLTPRPEPYPGNLETWNGEWLEHPMEWIKACLARAHRAATGGGYRMSIPVQRWDDDIVLYDAIEELERLRAENAKYRQVQVAWLQLGCQGCGMYFLSAVASGQRQPLFCDPCLETAKARSSGL